MNRKPVTISIICLFLALTTAPSVGVISMQSTSPLTGTVTGQADSDSSTLYVGGSGPDNYTSIQAAVDDASDGDTVFVYDDMSPYRENVVVDVAVHLVGEERNTTVIGDVEDTAVTITADNVTLSGFTIHNVWAGIAVAANGSQIQGNHIVNVTAWGIDLSFSSDVHVTGNIVTHTFDGIRLRNSTDNTIGYNVLSANGNGIYDDGFSCHNVLMNNTISENREGLYLSSLSSHNTISGNIFRGNRVISGSYGLGLFGLSHHNVVSHNRFLDNDRGIYLTSSNHNTISRNYFEGNDCGIYSVHLSTNNVTANTFYRNTKGIHLKHSYDNRVTYNTFLFNDVAASFEYHQEQWISHNTWNRNYWNRPRLLPKPILGQRPLTPWVNMDWRPLLLPRGGGIP